MRQKSSHKTLVALHTPRYSATQLSERLKAAVCLRFVYLFTD